MPKTLNDIVDTLAREKTIENLIRKMKVSQGELNENLKDLAQDLYISLLTKDEKKIQGLYERGELNYFITQMISNNIHSKNSPYYMTYKRGYKEEMEEKYDKD